MDLNFFNHLDDSQRLWQFYMAFSVAVWVLLWIGVRRWLWWVFKGLLLGVTASILFSPGPLIDGVKSPLFMVLGMEILANPAQIPMPLVRPLLINAGVASFAFIVIFFLLRNYAEVQGGGSSSGGGKTNAKDELKKQDKEMKKALKQHKKDQAKKKKKEKVVKRLKELQEESQKAIKVSQSPIHPSPDRKEPTL